MVTSGGQNDLKCHVQLSTKGQPGKKVEEEKKDVFNFVDWHQDLAFAHGLKTSMAFVINYVFFPRLAAMFLNATMN